MRGVCRKAENCSKISKQYAYFRAVSAYFRGVSAYFRGVSAYFRLETSFQISRKKFWAIWGHYGNRGFTMILRLKVLVHNIHDRLSLSSFCNESSAHKTAQTATDSGKKKAYTALLQCRTFLCRKNGGHRGKISVVDMVFLVFYRVFVSTTDLESFSLRPEKFPKRFSFGGCRVRFFFSADLHNIYRRLRTTCPHLDAADPKRNSVREIRKSGGGQTMKSTL